MQTPLILMDMAGDGPRIVIEGRRENWPGGARTLTRRDPCREPNRQVRWFGAELDSEGAQVWFRITLEAARRMKAHTPEACGGRLVDALLAWLTPDRSSTASRSRSPRTATRGSSATVAEVSPGRGSNAHAKFDDQFD